jgi:hypothetical protein
LPHRQRSRWRTPSSAIAIRTIQPVRSKKQTATKTMKGVARRTSRLSMPATYSAMTSTNAAGIAATIQRVGGPASRRARIDGDRRRAFQRRTSAT